MGNCRNVYKNKAALNRHIRTSKVHATRALECPGCELKITRADSFLRHFEGEAYADCLAVLLADMKVDSLDQCTTIAVKEKYGTAYTPQAEAT